MIRLLFQARCVRAPWLALAGMIACLALATPASAQVPKAFDYHEDPIDLGFRVKVPAEWQFIPPQPGDPNLIGKYDPKNDLGFMVGDRMWVYHVWLVKFDRRKQASDDKDGPSFRIPGPKTVEEFVRSGLEVSGNWKRNEKEGGPLQIQGVVADWSVYELTKDGTPCRVYAAKYKLSDDVDIALLANGPGDPKKWMKHENAFQTMGKSFRRLELRQHASAAAREGDSAFRTEKRAELEAKVKGQPGWKLYETPDYFIISNNPDKEFIDELMIRIQAIRKSYEEMYPPEKVLELKKLYDAAVAKKKADDKASGKAQPEDEPEPSAEPGAQGGDGRTVAKTARESATPLEQSRCSVVRVVQNQDQYHSYGGPGGSAGYWNWGDEELVIYDDKAVGGRKNTWQVLNHEAFHQYIFYFFGNLSPHSWYNEGTGDFYSGYQLKNGRFELKPFDWRVGTIKEALRQRTSGKQTYVPLKELVRYTQAEYYGRNKYEIDGGNNYAQGWSLIWFLRTGPKNARGWNKAWTPILDNYLRALAETNDLDQAVDRAFAGVDFDELERAWIEYTLAI